DPADRAAREGPARDLTIARASKELLAPRDDVWSFIAEPYHLADWWPGVSGVEPDRRGLSPGARWKLIAGRPNGGPLSAILRPAEAAGILLVVEVGPPRLLRVQFVNDRVDAELLLEEAAPDRTLAVLALEGTW